MLCVSVFSLYLFPIYPDEIQVRFWLSRLLNDYPYKISGAPTCISSFFQPIQATLYLPSLVNWVIHGGLNNIVALRLVGIFVALFWVSGLAYYLNKKNKSTVLNGDIKLGSNFKNMNSVGFIIAIFFIGVFPVFLISNRNEQLILPSIILLILVFLGCNQSHSKMTFWKKMTLVFIYFLSVSLVLFGHPKGLFLMPFFLLVGFNLFRTFNSKTALIGGMVLTLFHVFQAYIAWTSAFQCKEMPQFSLMLKSFSFDPASLIYDPAYFFQTAYRSLINFHKYLNQIGFQKLTDISYLPSQSLAISAKIANFFIKLNTSIIFFTLLVSLPICFYKKDLVIRRVVSINLLLLVLFICGLISAIFNLPKNWYDAGYMYALLVIILIFFLGENFHKYFQTNIARRIMIYFGAVSLLSQAVFIQRNLLPFLSDYSGPGVPIATYEHIKLQHELKAASQACKIDPVSSKRVIVDDYTYLYFRKSKWPMAISYIGFHNDENGVRDFFSKINSDGLVVNCFSSLIRPYEAVIKKEGSICCITKVDLVNLSNHR